MPFSAAYVTSNKTLMFYAHRTGTGTGVLHTTVRAYYGYKYGQCVGHILQPKSKQDGGIRSARQFRMSLSSGVDTDHTEKTVIRWSITG